jgi:hypothetical protein
MPKIKVAKERPLAPPGPHVLTLDESSEKQIESYEGSGTVQKLLWKFATEKLAEDGEPYEVTVFTGTEYGNPKAKLTPFLDMMLPGITPAEARDLDTEQLIGTRYEAQIRHTTSLKDPSRKYAEIVYLRPLPGPEAKSDPFTRE